MGLRGTKWLIAGGALLVLASSASALWVITRSPTLAEWLTGWDAERQMIVPRANKTDRLPLTDPNALAARHDFEELKRLGRPSVAAIWAARMTLPAPSEWIRQSSPPAPVDPTAPLAYAAARATEPAQRDPFRVIEEGPGTVVGPQASIPMPMPRPTIDAREEEEEEEEEEIIPLPIPRPRNAPSIPSIAAVPLPPERAVPLGTPPAAAPAAPQQQATAPPAPPEAVRTTRFGPAGPSSEENPARMNIEPQARTQVAALSVPQRDPEPAQRPAPPSIMTPFGIPYTLQHASVETQCFPPQLVELLRRLERATGQKPIITSGYRTRGRSGSLHRRCMAADVMVPGVSSTELARIARTIPGMGGVGQYCHPNLVHIDIGTARDWKYGCGTFFALRENTVPAPTAVAAPVPANATTLGFGGAARGFTR